MSVSKSSSAWPVDRPTPDEMIIMLRTELDKMRFTAVEWADCALQMYKVTHSRKARQIFKKTEKFVMNQNWLDTVVL